MCARLVVWLTVRPPSSHPGWLFGWDLCVCVNGRFALTVLSAGVYSPQVVVFVRVFALVAVRGSSLACLCLALVSRSCLWIARRDCFVATHFALFWLFSCMSYLLPFLDHTVFLFPLVLHIIGSILLPSHASWVLSCFQKSMFVLGRGRQVSCSSKRLWPPPFLPLPLFPFVFPISNSWGAF